MRVLGILLLIGGLAALIWGGFTYKKTNEVLDVGDLEVQSRTSEHVSVPPIAGGAAVLAGAVLLFASDRRKRVA
jgi:hypothetical protein